MILRALALIGALLLAPLPAWATIALVNTAQGSTTSSVTSLTAAALNVTSGNLLIIICRNGTSSSTTVTAKDTAGNTFTNVVSATPDTGNRITLFYAKNVTGNANDVGECDFSSGESFDATLVLQYSGADTSSPLDASTTGICSSGCGLTITSSTFSTTSANEVIVAGGSLGQCNNTFSAGGTYTLEVADSGTTCAVFTQSEDKIVSSTQTNVTTTLTNNSAPSSWELVVATFKQVAGGAATCPRTLALTGVGC